MDRISKDARSRNMRAIRSANTTPELIVRRLLHGMGFRFRLHAVDIPGKPDVVVRCRKQAIFVHGCFWHSHQACADGRVPRSNTEYWEGKLARTKLRDRQNAIKLTQAGWSVLVVWECETASPSILADKLRTFMLGNA